MIYESVEGFIVSNSYMFIALFFLLVLAITEYLVVYFAKRNEDRGNIILDAIGIKLLSLACAVMITFIVVLTVSTLLLVVDVLITNFKGVLMMLGVVAIIVGFFAVNVQVVKKHSKKIVHRKRFKKGDRLRAIEEELDEYEDVTLKDSYDYEFTKNLDYDIIEVKSLTKESCWRGETREFKEEYFMKAKKKK